MSKRRISRLIDARAGQIKSWHLEITRNRRGGLLTGILKACRDGELRVWTGDSEVVDRLQRADRSGYFLCGQGLAVRFGWVM
jgi:hypothetical protein